MCRTCILLADRLVNIGGVGRGVKDIPDVLAIDISTLLVLRVIEEVGGEDALIASERYRLKELCPPTLVLPCRLYVIS